MALKNCKECAKSISTDANPCPHCGKKNPHGMSALMKYGGGFLAVVFGLPMLAGMCSAVSGTRSASAGSNSAPVAAVEAPAIPAIGISARALWDDYQANEVSADNVYKGRDLAVTGTVSSIDKDFANDIVVKLATPNMFQHVQAEMKKSEAGAAAGLSKGQQVTVLCKGKGLIIGTPMLDDCSFAR